MEVYIAAFDENVCIYLEMKSEILNFVRYVSVKFCINLFLHNLNVLNANLSNNILCLMSFDVFVAHKYTLSILCVIWS